MKLLISKAKEYSSQLRTFLCLWAFVTAKFLFLKGGYAATVFSPKALSIVLFSLSLTSVIFVLNLIMTKQTEKRTADIVSAAVLLVYYCAFGGAMVYPLSQEHICASFAVIAACVLLLIKQVRIFSLPAAVCAAFIEPAVSACMLPALLCMSAVMIFIHREKEETVKKKPKSKKKEKNSILQKIAGLSAKIPSAVYCAVFLLILIFSYIWYFHCNPYGPFTSAEKILQYVKNLSLVLLENLPVIIFALLIWIELVKSAGGSIKYFVAAAAGFILCCASRFILSAEMLMPYIYFSSALFTGFAMQVLFLQNRSECIPSFIEKIKRFAPAMLIILPLYTGICYSYIG